MKRKIYRNLLVQYKGGGYDGCYWEWNFFLFDGRGKFHDIASSGHRAITTAEEAKALLASKQENTWDEGYYKFNIKSKKSVQEFQSETNPRLVDIVGNKVNAIYKKILMTFDCDECENTIALDKFNSSEYPNMFHDPHNYTGNGGVGIIQYGKLCEDCYLNHSCGYCGEFNEPEKNNVDEQGRCEYCKPEVKVGAS